MNVCVFAYLRINIFETKRKKNPEIQPYHMHVFSPQNLSFVVKQTSRRFLGVGRVLKSVTRPVFHGDKQKQKVFYPKAVQMTN